MPVVGKSGTSKIFVSSEGRKQIMGLSKPLIQRIAGAGRGGLTPGSSDRRVKLTDTLPLSVEVMNEWMYTSISPMTSCHARDMEHG